MNLLGLRKLIGDMLSSPARPSLRTEDVLNVDFVNPEASGPWALDVLVNDGSGTDATRTFRVTVEEKTDEPTFNLRLTLAQVSALLIDGHREKFPTLDSADSTVTLFQDVKRWYLDNPATHAPAHWAQVKDNHEGAGWRTVGTSDKSGHAAAWGALTKEMQRRGIRYGELAAHTTDMENGHELSAEDGTGFRILKPGQEITR
ncbi:hypothetical protein [Streptomyces sp. NPDC058252]|uniref:hypothetical protein n=1 Tax=Streptomyces sp. NPDC058252 TaxID=3346405 RepID=UPI0036E466B6